MSWIIAIIFGAVAGWLAGLLFKGGGFGLLVNIIVGIIGGVIGNWLFSVLGISTSGWIMSLIAAIVGGVILVWIVSLVKKLIK